MKQPKNLSVLFAERSISGHRLSYVRILAAEALARGYQVHVALPHGASDSHELDAHLGDVAHSLTLHPYEGGLEPLASLSRELNVDRTVVTDGDALAFELARRRKWPGGNSLSLLIMRESAQGDGIWLKRRLKKLAKKTIIKLASNVSDVELAVLKSATWKGSSNLRVAIDPVMMECTQTDVTSIRGAWQLDPSIYWFAVLGAITERKNVPLLIRSMLEASTPSAGLLVAGKIDPAIRQDIDLAASALLGAGHRIIIQDRILSNIELDAAVTAADCILLAHSNEGPSGLLGKAACAGTRVIAAGAQSLKADIKGLGGSAEWVALQPAPIAAAMKRALNAPPARRKLRPDVHSFIEAFLPKE